MVNEESFEEVFELMQVAFPETEIRTYEGQRALLPHPSYRIDAERDDQGQLLGFLASWNWSTFRFVEHIAVNVAIRGGGIGKRMLMKYMSSASTPIVLEVEPPTTLDATRRIEFYKRCGFHLNRFPYAQPPLREGQAMLPLHIMSYPNPLTESEFNPCKEVLFTEVYRQPVGLV
ncbi:GNAT family N-acetyltransferase [Paenibacillus qinlingensis]|uniref:Ribosomal protein S18 acetylase RimI-like enzyme n=1 Tax=Paenibacillus qinlingensis TaxID=1837343 RepID=A0ABU1NYB9_9BACL|nr:GNAT family N-acetyltransferase [Paenibacillus qinlingensis]MDR6552002.1 ribosomal protein S18 acetylase RimI-like enzyme [Paenibacillus qinlingensis]